MLARILALTFAALGVFIVIPVSPVDAAPAEKRGCCSHHQGVCGCASHVVQCCDGSGSPTCTCAAE